MTQFTEKQQATSDATGAISFTMTTAPPGLVLTGSISIPQAPSGAFFHCTAADDDWGTWAGPALHNPVQSNAQIPLAVTGTGLLPNTNYVCVFAGTQQSSGMEPAVWPTTTLTTPYSSVTLQPSQLFSFAGALSFFTFGPYPTQGFASLRLNVGSPIVAGQLLVDIRWTDADGNIVGERKAVVNEVAQLSIQTPHLSDFVTVLVTSSTTLTSVIEVAQTTETAAAFAGNETQFGTQAVGGGATATLLAINMLFAGPAYFFLNPGGAATFTSHIYAKDSGGVLNQLCRFDQNDVTGSKVIKLNLIIPPWPILVDYTNGDAGSHTPVAALVMDGWRVG